MDVSRRDAPRAVHLRRPDPSQSELHGCQRHEQGRDRDRLMLTVSGKGTGSGKIKGTMAFDRKDYGMDSSIHFIKIAERVEVNDALKGQRVGGPPLVFQQ
jgi:hypothetical protein